MCRVPAWSDQQKAAQARVKGDRGLQSSAEAGGEEGKTGTTIPDWVLELGIRAAL
jgi:hypothetical protein